MTTKITFEGKLIDFEGKAYDAEPLKNLLGLIINKFPLYPEKYYDSNLAQINNDIKDVHWKLCSEPYFNAFMRPTSNEIGINLFVILTILATPNISTYINESHSKATISIDDAKKSIENIPGLLITELDQLFNIWAKAQGECVEHGVWNLADFPLIQYFYFFEPIGRFLVWHETAHWHLRRFNDSTKRVFFDRTQSHITNFIQDEYSDNNLSKIVIRNLNNVEIRENWVEEITCDVMSTFCHITNFVEAYQRRDFYAALAIVFGMFQYQTYFFSRFYEEELSYHSHPPVAFRRDVLYYIIAKELDMTLHDFIQYEFGAGLLADGILSGILKEYSSAY